MAPEDDGNQVTSQFSKIPPDEEGHVFQPVTGFNGLVPVPVPIVGHEPTFGLHDERGRSLLELRVFNGRVEAKYYAADLDEAAVKLVQHMLDMEVPIGGDDGHESRHPAENYGTAPRAAY